MKHVNYILCTFTGIRYFAAAVFVLPPDQKKKRVKTSQRGEEIHPTRTHTHECHNYSTLFSTR